MAWTKEEKLAYQRAWRKQYRLQHLDEIRAKDRQRLPRSKDKQLANRLRTRYQISLEHYNQLVESQQGLCAICGQPKHRLVIDHCHHTNQVRALLCDSCNTRLSGFEDSAWSTKAQAYINKYKG